MLDVIHVFFEEDITPQFEDHIKYKDAVREQIYPALYKRPYKYGSKTSQTTTYGIGPDEDISQIPEMKEIPEDERVTKPFIPATNPEDLPGILDAPLA